MKNKSRYVGNIIKATIISIFLIIIVIKNQDIISKLIILPFLFCGIFTIGKNACLLKENKRPANIFSKLFVLSFLTFWFGFLVIWSYLCIRKNNYFPLVFTIPFWIAGIYIVRKFLLGMNSKEERKNKESKFNFQITISSFLVLLVLIIGITCLYFGLKDTYILNKITREYMTTNGYFRDYDIYNTSKDGTTYKLFYTYEIDEKEYTISTDYGVGYIPETNSVREIKYNPNNPDEAIIVGTNSSNFLIFFGAFFTLGGTAFVLVALQMKGLFDTVKIDVVGTYIGFVMLIVGAGIVLFQTGTTSSFIETIKIMGFWFLIPVLFTGIGIFQIIKCLYRKN